MSTTDWRTSYTDEHGKLCEAHADHRLRNFAWFEKNMGINRETLRRARDRNALQMSSPGGTFTTPACVYTWIKKQQSRSFLTGVNHANQRGRGAA